MRKLPVWYYDEFVQNGTDYTNRDEILGYDQSMDKIRNIGKEMETMLGLIDLRPGEKVLEIGCGTGEFTIELSKHCKGVVALDISSGMVEFARKKAHWARRDNIELVNSGFLTYDPAERKFNVIVTQLVLHHLPDFWKLAALKNISSMLEPEGRFYLRDVIYSSEIYDYDSFFSQTLRNIPHDAGDKMVDDFVHHIKEEFSTFDWVMEGLLEKAGFTIEKAFYEDGFMATYLCRKN
ncbi:class I SAM-dependent methyltransferase [Methanolobus sp. WCC5]|uniref:class I SAM-dependent methyltransferase n=1 Tax=Methanolobus sp. WCC5 TaxID=3125785 RepID=UPI00324FDA78